MKHIFSALALALAIGGAAAPAFAEGSQDFNLHNYTGMSFNELYVAPMSQTDSWGNNLIPDGKVLGEGAIGITFNKNNEECAYGIKVVTPEGKYYEVMDVDLCKVTDFGFVLEGGKVVYKTAE
ncbi:MAG: hypothetical protein JWM80_2684 [Cyanobacteria bacterium RYN_339]|nr:hypothetical protein [Cyanobacteria bacterium RYN_339]